MKNKRKAFWKNFKFKYKLTITNENTLEEIVGIHVSKLNGVSVLLSAVTVIFLIASLIIVFTPLRNYLPGYMNTEVREQVVTNALRADSLQWLMERQRMYIMNIQDIISGNVKTDSIHSIDSLTVVRSEELMERTQAEDEFRKQYEETERYNLTTIDNAPAVTGLIFFRPTRGMISSGFDLGWYRNFGDLYGRYGLRHPGTAQSESGVCLQTLRFVVEESGRYRKGR